MKLQNRTSCEPLSSIPSDLGKCVHEELMGNLVCANAQLVPATGHPGARMHSFLFRFIGMGPNNVRAAAFRSEHTPR
jgi:hypothetical protein